MPRKTLALWLVLIGLGLGVLGNLFFYQKELGLSFLLFVGVVVLVVLAASRPAQTPVNRRNLWPIIPLLIFAGMVAVHTAPSLMALNIAAALTLGALGLHYLPLDRPLDEAPLEEHVAGVLQTGIFAAFAAIPEVGGAWAWLRERSWQGRTAVAVVRGLALAVPIVLVFAVLLGAADEVFADVLDQVWRLLALNPDASLIDQAMITGMIGWLAIGALAYGLARRRNANSTVTVPAADADASAEDDEPETADAYFAYGDEQPVPLQTAQTADTPPKRKQSLFRLSIIEAGIVLGLVDLLFAAFVIVQLTYFFGGADTLERTGLSYAQYARRGFFELVTVSVLTLGLVLWLRQATIRPARRDNRLFIALAIGVVALTSVMLVSAAQRMYLYEEAFGFTHLRVFTHVFMLWLGILFVFFVLSLFEVKPRIFALGVLLVSIGYLLTLNAMNVDHYIAERNIARYYQGYALDLSFLGQLSADAVPAVITLYQDKTTNAEARKWAGQWLAYQLQLLENQPDQTLFSFNFARHNARAQLHALEQTLPAYNPAFFWEIFSRDTFDIYAATPEPFSR
jgi:hypothetical protein